MAAVPDPHGDLSSIAVKVSGLPQFSLPLVITTVLKCFPDLVEVNAKMSGPKTKHQYQSKPNAANYFSKFGGDLV